MRLKEKVAIVTGGASGIGKAICIAFAREGGQVVIVDIDKAKSESEMERGWSVMRPMRNDSAALSNRRCKRR